MRLIDEYKATDDICEHITTKAVSRVVAILQSQPTVDAIPVEWVKEWAMKSENTYNREQIVEMLNDWEKENDQTR